MTIASKRLLIRSSPRKDRHNIVDRRGHIAPVFRQQRNDSCGSAERECEGLRPQIEKLDLELPIGNRPGLSDQQIEPLLSDRAVALLVDVDPASPSRRLAVVPAAGRRSARETARSSPAWS